MSLNPYCYSLVNWAGNLGQGKDPSASLLEDEDECQTANSCAVLSAVVLRYQGCLLIEHLLCAEYLAVVSKMAVCEGATPSTTSPPHTKTPLKSNRSSVKQLA